MKNTIAKIMEQVQTFQTESDYNSALTCLEEALVFQPDDYSLWSSHGLTLEKLGRYEEALASFRRSTKIEPTYCDHYNAGNMLLALGKYKEALDEFDLSIKLRIDYPEAWVNRGIALYSLSSSSWPDAEVSFDRALSLDINSAPAIRCKAILYGRMNEREKAEAHYRRLTELQPNNASAWFEYGRALGTLPESGQIDILPKGRLFTALDALERAIALDSGNIAAIAERIQVLLYLAHGLSSACNAYLAIDPNFDLTPATRTLTKLRHALDAACLQFPNDPWFEARRDEVNEAFGSGSTASK